MTIRLYNTAARRKEVFEPIKEGHVGIYACGVTVYDFCHIGHARSAIVFDVLVRYLRAKGWIVTYVRNFTDVDDKIIDRAQQLGKEASTIAQEYIDAFHEDMGRIGVLNADIEPRATEHISDMIEMIKTLLEKGYAYAGGEDVFFSVEAFKDYGRLSGRKLEDMQAGSRIAVDKKKHHPMDFVLWKGAKPGEPQWDSPWGKGRPGWHIECSVMSNRYLGPSFDIHGGGKDLLFPHHENERAQSVAATGGNFARFWVHNGFVTVESEKMSKSLGNFLTIRDALKEYHPLVLRLFLLSRHYRSPMDFSREAVQGLQTGLVRLFRTLQNAEEIIGPYEVEENKRPLLQAEQDEPFLLSFVNMMEDDLNTAGAIGLIFEKIHQMNKIMNASQLTLDAEIRKSLENDRRHVLRAGHILGILEGTPARFFQELTELSEGTTLDPEAVEKMILERSEARANKDWARADKIRDLLKERGVILEDSPGGSKWRLDV